MKRLLLAVLTLLTMAFFSSCMRGISPFEAANGKARCGKTYIR